VRDIADQADDAGFDPRSSCGVLEELETSEPADYVFERIRQRLEHAIEREQEERHAARTKESINLAEYPESFEVASRMRAASSRCSARPIPARPTARWKRWRKPAAAPILRRCACWRWKTTSACRRSRGHGEPIKVSLITGEERRMAEGAPTSPAPSRCWTPGRPSRWP
jgi:ATP-dependent RNA helicase SUPV3L1/SUV3